MNSLNISLYMGVFYSPLFPIQGRALPDRMSIGGAKFQVEVFRTAQSVMRVAGMGGKRWSHMSQSALKAKEVANQQFSS